jgi:hypothetical protein
MSNIPSFVSQYLWDVPNDKISVKNDSNFIIERVLEYGNLESLNWLNEKYKKDQITKVLKTSKKISPKSGNFFALYYGIDKNTLLCIQKPFTQKQNRF